MPAQASDPSASALLLRLQQLRSDIARETEARAKAWPMPDAQPDTVFSVRNLWDYLALRQRDLSTVQRELTELGLSSLGRSEARLRPHLDAVIVALQRILGQAEVAGPPPGVMWRGEDLLQRRAAAMFGGERRDRRGRVIATLPSEAADDPAIVLALVEAGADGVRINTAHDDPPAWAAMARQARAAAARAGRPLMIEVDLPGPKVRTAGTPPRRRLREGEEFWLVPPGARPDDGPAPSVEVSLPQLLAQLQVGHEVWFDDGKLGGRVRRTAQLRGAVASPGAPAVLVRVEQVAERGRRLRSGKGLNFPETVIDLPLPTSDDLAILPSVLPFADAIGFSFVQRPAEIEALQDAIAAASSRRPTLLLKVETQLAVHNLPAMIVQAMQLGPVAVMIARGDLAVELGFERLAEIQEELLWLCEAAHVPVVWATQVLEGMAKRGSPTRAEVTDAAMAARAEAVMLNKGPHAAAAVRSLADVLRRMHRHQRKKSPILGVLKAWTEDR